MKELFKNKNFTLLFMGNLVSEMGNVIFGFVAGMYVQDLAKNSGGSILGIPAGIIFGLFVASGAFVRVLLTPIGGVLVDRMDKIRVIYITDYIRGVIFAVLAYVFFVGVTNEEAMILLLVISVVSGVISALFGPAISSVTPEIVGLDKVQTAQGANSIIQSSTMIVGVILGAAAFGLFEFHIALLINGISFLLSGFSEMFILAEHKEEVVVDKDETIMEGFRIGLNYLRNTNGLFTMMIFSLFLNFAFSPLFSVGVPFLFRYELGRSEWDLAWLNIAFGIAMMVSGVLIGGMVFKSVSRVIKQNLSLLSLSFMVVTALIYFLSQDMLSYGVFYTLMIVVHVLMAGAMMATNVPLNTALIKIIDQEYRGRVFGVISSISGGAVPIAIFLGGVVITYSSVAALGLVCAMLLMVPTFGFLTNRKVASLLETIDENNTVETELAYE